MNEETVNQFVIHVSDVFHFKHGITVFVGPLAGRKKIRFPLRVAIMIDGEHFTTVVLKGERMPGDQLPSDYIVVYTDESTNLNRDIVQSRKCSLVSLAD